MEKKKLLNKDYYFLKKELEYAQKRNVISENTVEEILALYDIKKNISFIRLLLTLGAVLLGLGILSFIASNWAELSKVTKFGLILTIYLGSNFAAYKYLTKYPKTSLSLIYLGVLTYGAGIFLIGQMFNYSGHFSQAFLLWSIGIIPIAIVLKDKIIYIFSQILALVYLNGSFELDIWPILMIFLTGVFYYINKFFSYSKMGTFFNNLVLLNTLLFLAIKGDFNENLVCIIFFIIGLAMYYAPIKFNETIFRLQGLILTGISGLILTFKDAWELIPYDYQVLVSIIFTIFYVIFFLVLTRKGNLISLAFICITIFRYYFDTFYDFLPKSLFFIISGLLFLSFGYYFEKLRKSGGYHGF